MPSDTSEYRRNSDHKFRQDDRALLFESKKIVADGKFAIEVLSASVAIHSLREEWNALVAEDSNALQGLDGTSTCEWYEAIVAAFPEAKQSQVIVARCDREVLGILPIVVRRDSRLGPRVLVATEFYGGRNGPLLKEQRSDVYQALIAGLDMASPGWLTLQMTLPENCSTSKLAIGFGTSSGYTGTCGLALESPFFPLLESAEEFKHGVSKSVLQMLRTSRNKFSKIGSLGFREFSEAHEVAELLEIVLAIEKKSWKHEAGTAITQQPRQEAFYRALFPLAIQHRILHAMVLFMGDEPIAYNFGLIRQGVFSCLKHSHVRDYDKLSPSYLVNEALFEALRNKGVMIFDFMGLAEPHKLRWSARNGSYTRHTWVFFNRSPKAKVVALALKNKQKLAQTWARVLQQK